MLIRIHFLQSKKFTSDTQGYSTEDK